MEKIYHTGQGRPCFILRTEDIEGLLKRNLTNLKNKRKKKNKNELIRNIIRFVKYVKNDKLI